MLRCAVVASVSVLTFAAVQGCGGHSSNSAAPDASSDEGASDAGPIEASVEAGPDCGAMPPTGTQLVASAEPLVVFGLIGDGHAVYEDLTTQELYGVAVTGGSPSDIGKMTSQAETVWSRGPALLWLPTVSDPMTSIAPLSSWTATGGTHVISTSVLAFDSYFYTYDVSSDGAYVAYFAMTKNSPMATLTVSTIDGQTQNALVTDVDLSNDSCFPPAIQFSGTTLIAQYCAPPGPDAGTTTESETIAAFASPAFTAVPLGTTFTPQAGAPAFTVDPTGTTALAAGPSGSGLALYPLAGGAPTTLDANGVSGFFTPGGDILYTTSAGALIRYFKASSTTTTLVTGGLAYPLDLSPDGNWLQAADQQSETTGLLDLYLASATTPGTANALVKTVTANPQGFTADSNYSLFGTNFPTNFGAAMYTLEASQSSGGAAYKVLSAATGPLFTSGSKLVCNTNQSKSTGAADIVSLDLSNDAGPTTLVTQADPNVFLTNAKAVVYSWYCNENTSAGIWTLTPP